MPRPPRLHVPGGCYHVMLRGNHREPLFAADRDRQTLNEIVADALARSGARLHGFCWMSNHLHSLIQVGERPLGKLMQRIAMRYSRYRHGILQTTGHLFERRYKAKLIDVDAYFLAVLRYIHLNPVNARMVADPAEYIWCSHRAYLGGETIPWVETHFGLSLFAAELPSARAAYARFVYSPEVEADVDVEIDAHPEDSRVLGTDTFLASIPSAVCRPRGAMTLELLVESICSRHGVRADVVRSRSAAHFLTPIRLEILHQAVEHRIAALSEVARYLNRDPSTLCKLVRMHRRETSRPD